MHLYQHIHAQLLCQFIQQLQLRVFQACNDEQDTICAHHPGLIHLVGIYNKILANHRQPAGSPSLPEIVIPSLEKTLIREHR